MIKLRQQQLKPSLQERMVNQTKVTQKLMRLELINHIFDVIDVIPIIVINVVLIRDTLAMSSRVVA